MNILQVLPSLDVGGVETGTIDLARYLMSHGHKAIVISSGGRLVKELNSAGARHYALPVGKKDLVNGIMMVRAIAEIIRREDIDIVHARSRIPALAAYFAAKLTNRIFITTAHGYYKKHFLSEVMGWGRYVIVASNIMAKHMVSDFGVPHERIRLIPRGVDLSRFIFRVPATHYSKEFTIGMISRITPLKGHTDFIKAVAILNRQIPQLKVVIAGEAPKEKYRDELDLLVRRLGLTRTIQFIGAKEDVPAVMSSLDVIVSATITPEAFGRVIIEAQATGVPVVSTMVGGVVDIVEDGKTGLLCRPMDPKDMAEKILRIHRDADLCKSIVTAARKRIEERYGLELMMTRTIAVYEEALRSLNILVVKLSAIGDVILSVPSLRAIRAKFPNANIKVLVGLECRSALDRCPYINERIVCDLKDKDRGYAGLFRLGKELRKSCFDMVIDLQNNKKSHILSFLTFAPFRYGYDNRKFSFFLNKKIKDDAPYLDPIEHQFRVLKLAGIKPADKDLELWPSPADEEQAEKLLSEGWIKPGQELVGINVAASSRWTTKNWPANYVAELCDRLAKELNIRSVLTGTNADMETINKVSKLDSSKPIIVAGKTSIPVLAALMKSFAAYVTPDSAPMHIAAAMRVPFVALFGPTDPARHLPPSDSHALLFKAKELRCGPCYSPRCSKNVKCMKKI
ncbi:MAG: glycosyltransferase, partial [Candidatus Omnitrophota bacterium]